ASGTLVRFPDGSSSPGDSRGKRVRHLWQAPRLRPQRVPLAPADQPALEPEHPDRPDPGRRRDDQAPQRVHLVPQGRQGRPGLTPPPTTTTAVGVPAAVSPRLPSDLPLAHRKWSQPTGPVWYGLPST